MFLRGFSSRLFPFLFGGTFIEGIAVIAGYAVYGMRFPFLFGGTFIEGEDNTLRGIAHCPDFPSFSEGLSLRVDKHCRFWPHHRISLPFRRDFH